MTERTIRIVLADDHAVLRSGLRALLDSEPGMKVVGEASDGKQAVELAKTLNPDVLVMDISMPDMDGLAAARAISSLELPCRVIMLTVHAEEAYLLKALQAGASGYVHKSSADRELMGAIRAANRGDVFLYPSAVKRLLTEYLRGIRKESDTDRLDVLTERERQVLRYTAEGFSNQEIADKLVLSPKTVDTYRQRIMEKLDLHHRSELIRYALKTGLLAAPD